MDSFGHADVLRPLSLLPGFVCRPMADGCLKWREGLVRGTLRQLPKSEQGIACPLSAASVTSFMTLPRKGSQEAWKQSSDFVLFSLKLRPVVVWLAWDTAKCQVSCSVLRSYFHKFDVFNLHVEKRWINILIQTSSHVILHYCVLITVFCLWCFEFLVKQNHILQLNPANLLDGESRLSQSKATAARISHFILKNGVVSHLNSNSVYKSPTHANNVSLV